MSRRAARIAAVEVLYGADLRGVEASKLLEERRELDPYALHLVTGVRDRLTELDALLAAHSVDWTTERMSPVDRNVLRVGVLELLEKDVPRAAAIDEAVELAKRFSGEEAARFVNGVLAAVMRAVYDGGGSDNGSGAGETGGVTSGGGEAADSAGG